MTNPAPHQPTQPGAVGLLLAASPVAAQATAISARLALGRRGGVLRRVNLPPAAADIELSAHAGIARASHILRQERYLDRDVIVSFSCESALENVRGRSADLAFALAFVTGLLPASPWPPLCATGQLTEDGGILPVEAVVAKITASLNWLPPGGVVLYPGGNDDDITPAQRAQAASSGIRLLAVYRLEEALHALGLGLSRTWLASPFRGLEPFGFEHAAIFFGREPEIAELRTIWQRRQQQGQPALLITGPSGAGKSSVMLAGLLPALARHGLAGPAAPPLFWAVLRPEDLPANIGEDNALITALSTAWGRGGEGGLRATGTAPLQAAALLAWLQQQRLAAGGGRFLVLCDQLEGWFGASIAPQARTRLFALLAALVAHGVGLVATITANMLPALERHPEFAACFGAEGHYALGPPREAASLQAIIQGPAHAAGLHYEAGLEAEIFAAAGHGGPDILPLLELLLTELHERRDLVTNQLSFASYRAVGGLEGVVSRRAEGVFAALDAAQQNMVPEMLWQLMTAGQIMADDFAPASPMQAVLAAFLARRLLVSNSTGQTRTDQTRTDQTKTGQTRTGQTSFGPAHAALLRQWQRAVDAHKTTQADVELWQEITREAAQWRRHERALIAAGPQLQAALALLARRAGQWRASEQPGVDYVRASQLRHGRRRLLVAAATGIPALAAVGFGMRAGADYITGLYETRLRFENIPLDAASHYTTAAAPYLHQHGLRVRKAVPGRTIAVITGNLGLYGGRAAAPGYGANVLTAQATPWAAPIGFTLEMAKPAAQIKLLRTALWADTQSGVTHPAWQAQALDDMGNVLASVSEPLLGSYTDIPAQWHNLRPNAAQKIFALRLSSDFRDSKGTPFAGFMAALIEEIDLVF